MLGDGYEAGIFGEGLALEAEMAGKGLALEAELLARDWGR